MKQFISKVKNLSRKAAEIKAAMQQVPPKVAEIREAVTATAGQLQQLKHEIQFSVADLKADQEDSLSEALLEINNSAEVFAKAGFALNGVDLELSPVQRLLVHLALVAEVHASVLRSLHQANQHRRTTRAILSALLQAQQMAETVELASLVYSEVIVGIGPTPSVRLCWLPEAAEAAIAPAPALATPPPQMPSAFGPGSFFERREVKSAPTVASAAAQVVPTMTAKVEPQAVQPETAATAAKTDPLARFKKMPILTRRDR